jgi:hypothetical protein
MDKKELKSLLQDAVEHELSSSQIDLLPGLKERLLAGTLVQGEKMNQIHTRRISRLVLAALAASALLAVASTTSQGRALAQEVLQLFRRADSYERPLPAGQVPGTPDPLAPTAMPPAPLVSIEEAEALAGFDAKELPTAPQGFDFTGARAQMGGLTIEYNAQGGGGALIINESTLGFMESEWDQAPAEFITAVKIGELNAEIVQGSYVVYADETTAKWNPDAPIMRLRWIENGIWFEMARFGGVETIAYLDQAALIALAESLVYEP